MTSKNEASLSRYTDFKNPYIETLRTEFAILYGWRVTLETKLSAGQKNTHWTYLIRLMRENGLLAVHYLKRSILRDIFNVSST